jgi:hypothetical protein
VTSRPAPRTSQRNAILDQLNEIAAQGERDAEVSELDVDQDGILKYSRGAPATGISVDEASDAVLQATRSWKGKTDVQVVQSVVDLPESIQEAMARDGAQDAHGFIRGDQIYVIADNLRDADHAVATVFHEGLGHLGLEKLFGTHLDRALTEMYRSNENLRNAVRVWRATNPNAYGGNLARAVEEVFAEMSEKGRAEASLISKIAAVIKNFARRMGLDLSYSDSEVNAILAMAHDQAVHGKQMSASVKGLRYMMSLWHGSPHDFEKFLTTKMGTGEGAQVYGWGLYFSSAKDVAQHYRDALGTKNFNLRDSATWVAESGEGLDKDEQRAIAAQYKYMITGSGVWRDLRQEYDRAWMDARSEGSAERERYWRKAIDTLDGLRDRIDKIPSSGRLYNVTVKQMNDKFLDWDKPLNDQSKFVRDALATLGFAMKDHAAAAKRVRELRAKLDNWGDRIRDTIDNDLVEATPARMTFLIDQLKAEHQEIHDQLSDAIDDATPLTGEQIYRQLVARFTDRGYRRHGRLFSSDEFNESAPQMASKALLDAGIRGNMYDDGFSRGGNGDTHNYVVFDHDDIEIAQKYSRPAEINERSKKVVSSIASKVPIESANVATRKMVFGWNSVGHLVAHYAKQFPQLALYAKAHLERRATQARWAQLFEGPYSAYEKLDRAEPKMAEAIRYLMSLTQFDIDPTKTWDQHDHLQSAVNVDRMKALVEDANRKYNVLRGKGHAQVYDDFRAINEATHLAMMSVSLHNLVASDPVLAKDVEGFETDPTDAFRESAQLHESAKNARRYWSDMVDNQVKRASEYVTQLRGEALGSSKEQRTKAMRLEPIELRIKSIQKSIEAMRNAPYFHLGRHGEHFVSFALRLGQDKKTVDQAAIDHAGKVIQDAGFKNVEISPDSTKPNVYIRVETIESRHQLEQIARQLKAQGWLKPDSEIKAAPRNTAGDTGTADSAPAWLQRYIELLQSSPMFEPLDGMTEKELEQLAAKKAQMVSHARELWLDMLPDTAIAKVMVHRNSVPGFDKDMVRNFAFRYQVGVNSLANLSANAKLNDAFTQMRAAVFDAQVSGSRQHKDVDLLHSLLSEVQVREAQRPLRSGQNWIDDWRALNHAFFLGFSPSYVMVNTTQLGVLLWPELAKKHGFAKSAKAIAGVTATAFNIMRETLAAGTKLGPKRALDAVITEDVLRKAGGVDEDTASFLMKIIADGIIDIGSASRELGRVAEGGASEKFDTALRWGASFGLYSETFTRLVAALAARKLNGNDLGYAHQVVEQSMLNYSDWNTARKMGKLGFAGPMTKVMTAFMQYNAQVMEKLYREFHTAIVSKKATAAEKAEARRFLGAHAVAVTTLAGTLGLPFASVAALAVEKLVDLFDDDDEPFDATAAWRNFLAQLLGKDVAEVVARGAPRAAGFDLSQRAGEQSLMPFTQFLTDKRQWREASTEMALRSYGAPVSMLLNILQGGEKIGSGDVIGGLTTAAPMALKGPLQSYRMTTDGYVDAQGNKLPMTPRSTAILTQLIGLTPQAKAEYTEARSDQQARKTVLVERSKTLRNGIVDAVMANDRDKARELIREAQKFDAANPAFAVLSDIDGAVKRRARVQADCARQQAAADRLQSEGRRCARPNWICEC